MAHVCFYVCVGVCANVCCVAAVVKDSGVSFFRRQIEPRRTFVIHVCMSDVKRTFC